MEQQYQSRIFVRDWINKLESSNYENTLVSQCLLEIKLKLSTSCSNLQHSYALLVERIISSSHLDWISSAYSAAAVMETMKMISPDLQLLSMMSLLQQLNVGIRLEFVVNLLEQLLQVGCYQSLLIQQSSVVSSNAQHIWERLVSFLASLPDKIANKFEQHKSFPLLHHEKFFVFLGVQISQVMELLSKKVQTGLELNTEFLALNIGQFCLRGKAEFIFKPLIPLLTYKTKHDFIWQRIIQKVIFRISDLCLESLLVCLFKNAPTSFCLSRILGDAVIEKPKVKFIILHKFLFTHTYTTYTLANNVISYVASCQSNGILLNETLLKLLNVWGSSSSIKHTSLEQHRYLTASILICTRCLDGKIDDNEKQGLVSSFMPAMKNHLESPDEKVRVLGMLVGERIAELVRLPSEKQTKLNFEYRSDDETKRLTSLCDKISEPNDSFYENQLKLYNEIREDIENFDKKALEAETTYTAAKSTFIKMADTLHINLSPRGGTEEQNTQPDDEIDSDDDLIPYDLPDETPFSKVQKPMYIRDCMEGIIKNEDGEHMEIYLNAISELVRNDDFAAKEVAVELCKVLLNLQDSFAINDFVKIRRNAIVEVLACNPKPVADYITREFYSEHYNLQQRMDMLDVLVMAAGRLSKIEKTDTKHEDIENYTLSSPGEALTWQQIIEQRIESKTRRFGKARKIAPQTSPDQFGPVAGYFFYPLMAGYDRRIRTMDLLGTDSIMLGRLLYALGTILYAATNSTAAEKMALSLLDFVTQLRRHSEPFVRRGCVYCVTMSTLAAPSLTDRLCDEVLVAREWLCDVIQNDDDSAAKEMAGKCLATMTGKMRGELQVKT